MIEQVYKLTVDKERVIEKIIHDENIQYNHLLLNMNEGLPERCTNSTVYLTVLRGTLSIRLGDQERHKYEVGSVLKIPRNIIMNVRNTSEEVLELIIIKAPVM